jgi:hypothetical protein
MLMKTRRMTDGQDLLNMKKYKREIVNKHMDVPRYCPYGIDREGDDWVGEASGACDVGM